LALQGGGNEIGGRQHIGGPGSTAVAQPCGGEVLAAVRLNKFGDAELVGLGRRGGEGERDIAEAKLKQPVAAPRLAVIIALGRRPAKDLDLAVVQPEPLVDRQRSAVRCRALVRQEYPRRTAFDDGGRDVLVSMSARLWVANMTLAFFLRSVLSHSRSCAANAGLSSTSQPSSMMMSVGEPSSRPSMRWNR
jgi:hypothetical protein